VAAALLGGACRPENPLHAGKLTDLPVGKTEEKEILGARVYLLRSEDDSVIAMWGISPLSDPANSRVQCFVFKRSDRTVQGEKGLFLDSCRGAWWSRDGRFLGYTGDPEGAPQPGPALTRIPSEVRDGRVELDLDVLKCLQDRRTDCL
jgi:nitrite reductase/ring-hydroxylating ferredoxin subunit